MIIQSQFLAFNDFFKPKPGFLIMEVLVSLLFCFAFIMMVLKFQSDILLLYERFFVRNLALDIAANCVDKAMFDEESVDICGRVFKIGIVKETNSIAGDSCGSGQVMVYWFNCKGGKEKVVL